MCIGPEAPASKPDTLLFNHRRDAQELIDTAIPLGRNTARTSAGGMKELSLWQSCQRECRARGRGQGGLPLVEADWAVLGCQQASSGDEGPVLLVANQQVLISEPYLVPRECLIHFLGVVKQQKSL